MADIVSSDRRSQIMGKIRGKNTSPEMVVRRLIYSLGYRYRLHSKKLTGRPDLVFSSRKKVIFVHGCFWHLHEGCPKGKPPETNRDYWIPKLQENKARDIRNQKELVCQGWKILVIWQCELKKIELVKERIIDFLEEK